MSDSQSYSSFTSHANEELTITPTKEELKATPVFASCANKVLYKNYSGNEPGGGYPTPKEAQGTESLMGWSTSMVVTIFYLHHPSLLSSLFLLYKKFCKIKPVLLNWSCCIFDLLCTLIWSEDFNIHWIITPVGNTLPNAPQDILGPPGHKGTARS